MASVKINPELERKLDGLARSLDKKAVLRVGFLEDATYPDGTPVAMVAAIQNFGAPARGIPPRPFFTNFVKDNEGQWGEQLARLLIGTGGDVERALNIMGLGMKGQLQQSIVNTLAPPLSPITLMLRKMQYDDPTLEVTGATVGEAARRVEAGEDYSDAPTKPLVWSGHLLASVDYEVDTAQ